MQNERKMNFATLSMQNGNHCKANITFIIFNYTHKNYAQMYILNFENFATIIFTSPQTLTQLFRSHVKQKNNPLLSFEDLQYANIVYNLYLYNQS